MPLYGLPARPTFPFAKPGAPAIRLGVPSIAVMLISWTHSEPDGGRKTFVGRHGLMKPEGNPMA